MDSKHKDPRMCSLYAAEVYNNLRVAECSEISHRKCAVLSSTGLWRFVKNITYEPKHFTYPSLLLIDISLKCT
ncbi:hypothetical protein Hanom_Chr11g01056691 [Helianthus anomalus]